MGGGDAVHFLESLEPALSLPGLGRLVPEAVYERLNFRDALLLPFVEGLVLGETLGAHALKAAVVCGVLVELLILNMDDVIHSVIQELAVMRDDHERSAVALEVVREEHYGIEVKVVGRLIEEQEV